MKKATMFVAAAALVISLAGCGSQTKETEEVTEKVIEAAVETEEATEAESETEEASEAESETEEASEAESETETEEVAEAESETEEETEAETETEEVTEAESETEEETEAETETEEVTEAESETEEAAEAEYSGLLFMDDTEENTAFNESAQADMDALAESLGAEVFAYTASGYAGADEDELTQEFLDRCESGEYDVIVVATSKLEAAVEEAEQEYPEITFVFLDEAYPEEVSETLAGLEEELGGAETDSSEAETEEAETESEMESESETEAETESEIGEEA